MLVSKKTSALIRLVTIKFVTGRKRRRSRAEFGYRSVTFILARHAERIVIADLYIDRIAFFQA